MVQNGCFYRNYNFYYNFNVMANWKFIGKNSIIMLEGFGGFIYRYIFIGELKLIL